MKKTALIILLTTCIDSFAAVYYVSTKGNDNSNGKITSPWLTWQKAFDNTEGGDTVFIRGGVYYVTGTLSEGVCHGVAVSGKKGTDSKWITIQNYPGENPVLDGSRMTTMTVRRGIYLNNCSYIILKGLTVRNVKEYGQYKGCPIATSILLSNSSFIKVERCVVTECGDGFSTSGLCDYISFLNCDSFKNVDFTDNGGFANGFTLTMFMSRGLYAQGTHVTLTGCRSWSNSDDGFDTYGANGYFTYIDCWAWNNGWGGRGMGNGDGFKSQQFNSPENGVQRTYIKCIAWNNRDQGFTSHVKGTDKTGIQHVYNCAAFKNGTNGFSFGLSDGGTPPCILRNNISFRNGRSQYLGFPAFIQDHNTWNHGLGVSKDDFLSLDPKGADSRRRSDGSLPEIPFLKLAAGSHLIDAGADVGLPSQGSAPDIGPFGTSADIKSGQKQETSIVKKLLRFFNIK